MTAPKGVTARQAWLYAEQVDSKVTDTQKTVAAIDGRYKDDITSLRTRLDRDVKSTAKRTDRLERLVADVGRRLAQDHDAIFELNQRFARMNELVGDGLKLNLAASIAGFTQEEIKEILAIQAEDELTDSAVITGMVNQIGSIKAQLSTVVDTVAETRGMVNGHDEKISNVTARVKHLETAFKEVKSSSTVSESVSKVPLFLGIVAGIITYVVAINNNDDVSNWRALGFAVAIGAITAGILSFFANQVVKIRKTKESSKSTTSEKNAEADTSKQRSSAPDDPTQVTPTPGQAEHKPDLAPAGS